MKMHAWFVTALVALCGLGGSGAETPPPSQNLVRNPSFELDANGDGIPDAWQPYRLCTPYGAGECTQDGSISYDGASSGRITQGHIYAAITGSTGWLQQGIVERGGGRTFRVSVYVRAGKPVPSRWDGYVKSIFPTRVRLYLFGHDPLRGDDYEGAASPIIEVGTEWQEISHTNTFAPPIHSVSVLLAREAQVGGGDVWFDRVEVVEARP
ncbi:MAG: hypothetical protein QGI83_18020 [Candidatus Latescibacteria bacterium]|jgi:hypothetical protein|nr:hypothetical protein [Candidatus Latescibacterota bacterium]